MLVSKHLRILKSLVCLGLLYISPVNASTFSKLTLPGSFQPPGISGTFSNTAQFSWIKHRFPTNTNYFSWNFGGGTDGGVIFGQPQSFGALTDIFIMFNQPAAFYSVGNGLSIDINNTIDMSNLRMKQAGNIIDVGSGSGFNTLVPYVADLSLLAAGENGWSINSAGAYHLFYNTRGTCLDCEMTVHLYGKAVVPIPATVWLFGSGLLMLTGLMHRRKSS